MWLIVVNKRVCCHFLLSSGLRREEANATTTCRDLVVCQMSHFLVNRPGMGSQAGVAGGSFMMLGLAETRG
jgi:hypothetical protein